MMPVGPLMIEHRRIERMITIIGREFDRIQDEKKVNPAKIDIFVDFIRFYADRCHHGKEEDILFRDLIKKDISEEHRKTMDELIAEHQWSRKKTAQLVDANRSYKGGDKKSISIIADCLGALNDFYPRHIDKEDRGFFIPVMSYFSTEEKKAMLEESYAFDRKLIHEKYEDMVSHME